MSHSKSYEASPSESTCSTCHNFRMNPNFRVAGKDGRSKHVCPKNYQHSLEDCPLGSLPDKARKFHGIKSSKKAIQPKQPKKSRSDYIAPKQTFDDFCKLNGQVIGDGPLNFQQKYELVEHYIHQNEAPTPKSKNYSVCACGAPVQKGVSKRPASMGKHFVCCPLQKNGTGGCGFFRFTDSNYQVPLTPNSPQKPAPRPVIQFESQSQDDMDYESFFTSGVKRSRAESLSPPRDRKHIKKEENLETISLLSPPTSPMMTPSSSASNSTEEGPMDLILERLASIEQALRSEQEPAWLVQLQKKIDRLLTLLERPPTIMLMPAPNTAPTHVAEPPNATHTQNQLRVDPTPKEEPEQPVIDFRVLGKLVDVLFEDGDRQMWYCGKVAALCPKLITVEFCNGDSSRHKPGKDMRECCHDPQRKMPSQ